MSEVRRCADGSCSCLAARAADSSLSAAARSMIDWHDFVVVETITFDDEDEDDLPAPQKVPNAATRSAADDDDDGDMEMDVEEESSSAATATLDDDEAEIKVRRDYVPAWARADNRSRLTQLCPICGQDIAINDLEEHMRIELLDPRFAEEKKVRAHTLSHSPCAIQSINQSITHSLTHSLTPSCAVGHDEQTKHHQSCRWRQHQALSQRSTRATGCWRRSLVMQRTHSCALDLRETSSPKTEPISLETRRSCSSAPRTTAQRRLTKYADCAYRARCHAQPFTYRTCGAPQAIWDGHSASIQRTSNAAMSTLTIQEQIEAIHRAKGLKYARSLSLSLSHSLSLDSW